MVKDFVWICSAIWHFCPHIDVWTTHNKHLVTMINVYPVNVYPVTRCIFPSQLIGWQKNNSDEIEVGKCQRASSPLSLHVQVTVTTSSYKHNRIT